MDDKGSTTFFRIDARIAKSPRRNGNIGKNRQAFARQRTPCMLSEKRCSLSLQSSVKRSDCRLSFFVFLHRRKKVPRCFCVHAHIYTNTRDSLPTRLLGNAPLLKRISRAFPAPRGAPFVDMQTMTRFPVPADSALPSRISSREESRLDSTPANPPEAASRRTSLHSRPFFIATRMYERSLSLP